MSVFTQYGFVVSCIGGHQALLGTLIDGGQACPRLTSANTVNSRFTLV